MTQKERIEMDKQIPKGSHGSQIEQAIFHLGVSRPITGQHLMYTIIIIPSLIYIYFALLDFPSNLARSASAACVKGQYEMTHYYIPPERQP